MDAINALILLAQSSRELLKRPIVIHVLDLDDTGAFFGQAALAELKRAGDSFMASILSSGITTTIGVRRL